MSRIIFDYLCQMPQFNWNDSIHIAQKMTARKLWNGVKIYSSFHLSKWRKKPIQWGTPVSISFEPTTSCNLRCPECPSGLRAFTRPIGMLNKDFFGKTIDELHKELLYLIFYFQGEPYLNPDFLDMVGYASKKKIYTATSTNAHYLNEANAKRTIESGLDRLIISIDGTTQDVYEQYRVGGKLDKVIEGTKNIVHWRKELKSKKPFIIFQFLVVKPNEHQIEDVKKLATELGVDEVRFKTAQIYDYENGNDLIPTIDRFSRYRKQENGTYAIKNKLMDHCWKLWHACVITWDGIVVPCCFDKDATHRFGDLKEKTFKEIWQNTAYQNFRGQIIKGRKHIDICANCSEGTKVWEED
jgi:radical SAM protein with 4Fe4S-binding SPASM domain